MPINIGGIKIGGVQSGASFNNGEVQFTSTHSKMNMQAQTGSFTVGNANIINNAGSGNFSIPTISKYDKVFTPL